MITAEEARKLAGPTVEDHVRNACVAIRKAAENKQRSVRLTGDFWVHDGYSGSKDWVKAKEMLIGLGFTVEFFYEERQFVDMYTIVKW